jgi:hypothetical protein
MRVNPNLVNKSLFQILKLHHTTEMNNKWKPQYYCLLYMIYNTVMHLLRQRLCKHGDYATIEESSVFRAVRVVPQTLLRSAQVNTSLVARRHCKRLDDARVGRGHVTACSAVTQQSKSCVFPRVRSRVYTRD